MGALLKELEQRRLSNVRVFCHDAVEIFNVCVPDNSLDRVLLFFPDPWPKRRYHKRRLIQTAFVEQVRTTLTAGGILHMATDWQDYAEYMLAIMGNAAGFVNLAGEGCHSPRPAYRPVTKFEARGLRFGHGVWDLLFQKK